MSKLSVFKKTVVYLLISVILTPGLLISWLISAPKVSAKSVDKTYDRSDVTKNPLAGVWTNSSGGLVTDGSNVDAYVEQDLSSDVVQSPGDYKVEASWNVDDENTKLAVYEVYDAGEVILTSNPVDQTQNADQTSSSAGDSGYLNLGTAKFTGVQTKIRLLGENSDDGDVSFLSFKVTHNNLLPSKVNVSFGPGVTSIYSKFATPLISWTPATDGDDQTLTYELRVSSDPNFTDPLLTKILETNISDASYLVKASDNLTDGVYYAQVRASDGEDFGEYSEAFRFIIDTLAPTVPTGLNASAVNGHVELNWNPSTDVTSGIFGYNISRVSSAGSVNLFSTTNSLLDNPGAGTFTYSISAIDNAMNESAVSTASNAVTFILLPVVTGLSVQAGNGEVQLTWDQVPGASGYIVRYFLASDPENELAAVFVTENTTKISNLINGSVYRFEVQAVDSVSGMFGTSTAVTTTPVVPAPPAVEASVVPVATFSPSASSVPQATAPVPTTTAPAPTTEPGKIKGEEVTKSSAEDQPFNWTPWIILIIIIVLAGAATGGYFYWTRGEETPVSQVTVTKKNSSATKNSTDQKAPPTKKNRW